MTFSETAGQLCGQCALLLGWRPSEFWDATPSELACVLAAMTPQGNDPVDSDQVAKMMKIFPDAPNGGE